VQIEEREYQVEAHEKTMPALMQGLPVLIQSPTRSGKSIMMAKVVRDLMRMIPNFRCVILIDRELLVRQLAQTVATVCGFIPGIACGSVSSRKDYGQYCTVASRQTIINDLGRVEPFNLIILDEAHLLGCQDVAKKQTQYETIITTLIGYNKNTRMLGYTATPWGLSYGFLYGDNNKETCTPWFSELTHKITYKELLDNKRLAPMGGVIIEDGTDLSQVSITAGEFNLSELSAEKCKHVKTVPLAVEEYAVDHSFIIIFCIDVKHINEVVEALNDKGIPATAYHSKQKKAAQKKALNGYKSGLYRCIVTALMLAIGFDHAATSCVIWLRDTLSSAFFLQGICRCMTFLPGKKALLIDITKSSRKHLRYKNGIFDLDDPIVKIPQVKKKDKDRGDEKPREAPFKICEGSTSRAHSCQECGKPFSVAQYRQAIDDNESQCPFCSSRLLEELTLLSLADPVPCKSRMHPVTMICPDCGFEYEQLIAKELPAMREVSFDEIAPDPPEWLDVVEFEIDIYEGRKGKRMLRLTLTLNEERLATAKSSNAWEYICIPPEYEGKAAWYGEQKWEKYCPDCGFHPEDLNLSLWTAQESFDRPIKVLASINKNGYYEISDIEFDRVEETFEDDFEDFQSLSGEESCGEDVPF